MGNLTESNLIPLTTNLKAGQRCLRIGNHIIPVGVGGIKPPAGSSDSYTEADITLGVVDQNGHFQPLKFTGTQASNSGSALEVSSYKSWNSTLPTPENEGIKFYKCIYTGSNSWGGYKASYTQGGWIYSSDSTYGLPYNKLQPTVGNVYDENGTLQASLYEKTGNLLKCDRGAAFLDYYNLNGDLYYKDGTLVAQDLNATYAAGSLIVSKAGLYKYDSNSLVLIDSDSNWNCCGYGEADSDSYLYAIKGTQLYGYNTTENTLTAINDMSNCSYVCGGCNSSVYLYNTKLEQNIIIRAGFALQNGIIYKLQGLQATSVKTYDTSSIQVTNVKQVIFGYTNGSSPALMMLLNTGAVYRHIVSTKTVTAQAFAQGTQDICGRRNVGNPISTIALKDGKAYVQKFQSGTYSLEQIGASDGWTAVSGFLALQAANQMFPNSYAYGICNGQLYSIKLTSSTFQTEVVLIDGHRDWKSVQGVYLIDNSHFAWAIRNDGLYKLAGNTVTRVGTFD